MREKFSLEDISIIRKRFLDGETAREIQKDYKKNVANIIYNNVYFDIEYNLLLKKRMEKVKPDHRPLKAYSDLYNICGIYRIYIRPSNLSYIGSSKNIGQRLNQHVLSLKYKTHSCQVLQDEYNLNARSNIFIEILKECQVENNYKYEVKFWEKFSEQNICISSKPNIYNYKTNKTPIEITKRRNKIFYKSTKQGSDCWEWIGRFNQGKPVIANVFASRYSYCLNTGKDPGELLVRHACDNPICVNPKHLVLGTYKDNSKDRIDRVRGWDNKVSPEIIRLIREKHLAGQKVKDLDKEFGFEVYHIVNNDSFYDPNYQPRYKMQTSKRNKRKLEEQDVKEIYQMSEDGLMSGEISRIKKLPQSMICRILNGRVWKKLFRERLDMTKPQ